MISRIVNSNAARCLFISLITFANYPCTSVAQIIATGDYAPAYDGSDPWWMGTSPSIGITGTGMIRVLNGSEISSLGTLLGEQPGAIGVVNISGKGSLWESFGGLNIGLGGCGSLSVDSGGRVDAEGTLLGFDPGSFGVLNINNGDLTTVTYSADIVTLGLSGSGELNIGPATRVNFGSCSIGRNGDGQGILTVSGTDSYLGLSSNGVGFAVGLFGTGTLVVENGGAVNKASSGSVKIGWFVSGVGDVLVTGNDSILDAGNALYVGFVGTGELIVADGGQVASLYVAIGSEFQSQGIATLTSSDTKLSANTILVGRLGTGTLEISDEAQVFVRDLLSVNSSSELSILGGTIEFTDLDGVLTNLGVISFAGGIIRNANLIDGNSPFLQDGGSLEPGISIGVTTIDSDYEFNRGVLEIELSGTGLAGLEIDLLNVIGEVDLVGDDLLANSELKIILGCHAQIGDEFVILDNDGKDPIVGMFSSGTIGKAVHAALEYTFLIDYSAGTGNDISLTVVAIAPQFDVLKKVSDEPLGCQKNGN